jgi:hypothetical protein
MRRETVMTKLNEAQQLREALGIEVAPFGVGEKRESFTKSGPGRAHAEGKDDKDRTLAQKSAGSYGRGLRNWITRQGIAANEARLAKRMQLAGR